MARRRLIDPDDLLDSSQVAEFMGLTSGAGAVRVYVGRFEDFPAPFLTRGRFMLWHRRDIEAFLKRHPGLGRRRARTDDQEGTT